MRILLFFFVIFYASLSADMPLLVEDLVSGKGKFKLESSLSYINSKSQNLSTGDPIIVPISNTGFVAIPSSFGESEQENDNFIGTLGIHYGLSNKADLYIRGSYLGSYRQQKELNTYTNTFENKPIDSWLGVNYEFLKDDSSIGVLGYIETALYEKNLNKSSYLHSLQIGSIVYKSIDPVVLVLNTTYRYSHKRKSKDGTYKPGNVLLLHPNVGFAVNEWITLSLGFELLHQRASRFDGSKNGLHRSFLQPTFGLGYGFSEDNILNLNFKAATQKDSNSSATLHWSYTF